MTDQIERPNLSRRGLLRAAAIIPVAMVPALAVASPAEAVYNGTIQRSEVLRRARNWYNRDIQYDRGREASDYEGSHWYRRDCSGFVSMCWHTSSINPNGGYSTRSLPSIAPQIAWSSLRPGDIVNSYDYHCMLFEKWSATSGAIRAYELTTVGMGMRCATHYVSNLRADGYIPRRYTKIRAG